MSLEQLIQLKQYYEQGFMTKEEYDQRRLALIDTSTDTRSTKDQPRGALGARPERPVYANRDFDRTNEDAMNIKEYVVVHPPTPNNKNLFTNAVPENPFSYKTEPVPIDPRRAREMPNNVKQFGDTTVIYAHTHAGGADRDEQIARLEEERKRLAWELFYAASVNDVPRIKELLDRGADVNQRDFDTEATPVIVAASKGQKHAVYYLVERGAEVNAQNIRGETALHEAVKLKFNEMALWLVKHGADIHLENYKGYSSYDLALPWLQKELKDERDHFLREQKKAIAAASKAAVAPPPMEEDYLDGSGTIQRGGTMQRSAQSPMNGMNTMPKGASSPMNGGTTMPRGGYDTMQKSQALDANNTMKRNPLEVLQATKTLRPKEGEYDEKYGAPINKRVIREEGGQIIESNIDSVPAHVHSPVQVSAQSEKKAPVTQEVMKIYMKNNSYKSIVVTSEHTAKDLADSVAEKLNMAKYANYFDVIESVRGQERRLDPNALIIASKKKWPLILGPTGNETELQCKFLVVPKRGTPENITMMYRDAIYGGQK